MHMRYQQQNVLLNLLDSLNELLNICTVSSLNYNRLYI